MNGPCTAPRVYDLCLNAPKREWFGFTDCAIRWALPLGTFYFYLIAYPLSFFRFCIAYNGVWHKDRPVTIALLSLFYPVMPFVHILLEVVNMVNRIRSPVPDEGASRLWFSLPQGVLSTLLQQSSMNVARMVALFMLAGNDATALEHIIEERLTTKPFWRDLMRQANVRLPLLLGFWDGTALKLEFPLDNTDIVIKLTDAYFGVGDLFLEYGTDFSCVADVERILATKEFAGADGETLSYRDREVLILEYCRPLPRLGVHSLDILTVATCNGTSKVLTCLYWGECTGPSSHFCTAGYVVDVEKEVIAAPCRWYAPYFATASDKLVGTKLPGIKRACEQACAAHERTPFPWMKTVGWDCMILAKGEVVFFEGNFGSIRIPRRIFLAPQNTWEFLKLYAWPFVGSRPNIGVGAREK